MEIRKNARLNQTELAELMGLPTGKGKISEIENGKLPINEENIRLWVKKCSHKMSDFYILSNRNDPD